ncbi:MAG: DUF1315 family protein [Pseudomonadota bacterium]
MDYQQVIDEMTPEVYARLKQAVETGRWPDGRLVTPEQREHALQAVIAWGERHLGTNERVGFIDKGGKDGDACDSDEPRPIRWQDS